MSSHSISFVVNGDIMQVACREQFTTLTSQKSVHIRVTGSGVTILSWGCGGCMRKNQENAYQIFASLIFTLHLLLHMISNTVTLVLCGVGHSMVTVIDEITNTIISEYVETFTYNIILLFL